MLLWQNCLASLQLWNQLPVTIRVTSANMSGLLQTSTEDVSVPMSGILLLMTAFLMNSM